MPKKSEKERTAIMYAYWNKWAGTKPAKVIRTKGITKDEWYIRDISPSEARKNVTEVTPSELDSTLTKGV